MTQNHTRSHVACQAHRSTVQLYQSPGTASRWLSSQTRTRSNSDHPFSRSAPCLSGPNGPNYGRDPPHTTLRYDTKTAMLDRSHENGCFVRMRAAGVAQNAETTRRADASTNRRSASFISLPPPSSSSLCPEIYR